MDVDVFHIPDHDAGRFGLGRAVDDDVIVGDHGILSLVNGDTFAEIVRRIGVVIPGKVDHIAGYTDRASGVDVDCGGFAEFPENVVGNDGFVPMESTSSFLNCSVFTMYR